MLRLLEIVFFFYFLTHIPITVLIDSQAIYPREWFPEQVLNLTDWYVKELKDTYFANPTTWYKSFVWVEQTIQLPFFFVAAYAFLIGGRTWIRIPAIVYSSHVATTVWPMLLSFYVDDFTKMVPPGPSTWEERMTLIAIYMPYFLIPVLILLTMLLSDTYKGKVAAATKVSANKAQKKKKAH